MCAEKTESKSVVLRVPVDAGGIDDRSGLPALKAVLVEPGGKTQAVGVKLDRSGKGVAEFKLAAPVGGRVLIGPPDADEEEMQGLQTLSAELRRRNWGEARELVLAPVIIRPWYWHWWLRWCRTFTIRGKLVCPDGNPVPGAEVCALDVDRFWWWCSKQQVGCAVTDANGAFTITFRWCCGWWPWWWWNRRYWQIDPKILRQIHEVVGPRPEFPPLPKPDPVPDTGPFQTILAGNVGLRDRARKIDDPGLLDRLRPELVSKLPAAPQLEALRIWPWAPWHPWSDCTPDIIFRATQDCGQGNVVVLDESCGDARWNIPTTLDVTLTTTSEACCRHPQPPECEEDGCIVLSHVCDDVVDSIGGNTGAWPVPAGYRNPSPDPMVPAHFSSDRPYGGTVPIRGVCTDWIDYYAFEVSGDNGATWGALPPEATGGMTRRYFNPGGPPYFPAVGFNFASVDGKWVAETLGHWESVNGGRIWVGDTTVLINWQTAGLFSDRTYRLRLRGYRDTGAGLVDLGIPHRCGSQDDNGVVIAIDNRITGPGSGHPTAPDHPVPPGGVHIETTEPDTDFVSIKLGVTQIGPCGHIDRDLISATNPLVIEFLAHDPVGHLAFYTMQALWGENSALNLLAAGTLSMVSPGQQGPDYGLALGQGAVAPKWNGGTMRLTITDGAAAFPVPCCYLLDLRAYKRTIVSCDDDYPHRSRSTMTLSVT